MVRYARFGGLFNEVWKMSFQGKKIQILVFYPPLRDEGLGIHGRDDNNDERDRTMGLLPHIWSSTIINHDSFSQDLPSSRPTVE